MFKNLLIATLSWLALTSNAAHATVTVSSGSPYPGDKSAVGTYEVEDIGTLQTHSSCAIDLNNHGQILGWYNIDGSEAERHFFVRDRDGTFHELASSYQGMPIQWIWLKDNERAYGIFNGYPGHYQLVLFTWDKQGGVVNLGTLPKGSISAINNKGQVLIQLGLPDRYPVIWDNGQIVRLRGLEGDLGIESVESYGHDMNDNGDVVGKCLIDLVYKNKVYKRFHAVIWENGLPKDLHSKLRKAENSEALLVNNLGDFYAVADNGGQLSRNGTVSAVLFTRLNDVFFFHLSKVYSLETKHVVFSSDHKSIEFAKDRDSIWMKVQHPFLVNNNGEVVAQGTTIFGEKHIILFTPKK